MKKNFDFPIYLKDPIHIETFYKEVGFDPNGSGQYKVILEDPFSAFYIKYLNNRAMAVGNQYMQEEYSKKPNSSKVPHNNDGDAVRHAFFSWMLSNKYGTFRAKQITDAHEISVPNDDKERAMDLKNNEIGRKASLKYPNLKTEAEIYNKLKELKKINLLKTKPYEIYK